ncbi:MAG: DUF4129 domain-containing protein [Thermoleophilia bacterium]|nr:DUF4129 domain-containing protein [Thermoleophilia bacterium]
MQASGRSGGWLTHNRSIRSALLGIAAFVLVFLIALGTNRSRSLVGATGGVPGTQLTLTVLYSALLGLATIGLCVIVYLLISGGMRGGRDKSPDRVHEMRFAWWVHALVLLFLAALIAGIVVAFIYLRDSGGGQQMPMQPGIPGPSEPFPGANQPDDPATTAAAKWTFIGVLAAAALGGMVLAWLRWRRRRALTWSPGVASTRRQELREVVEASLEDLEREPDPRTAVIRAYVGMEGVLAKHGLGRRPHEAPLEYLTRWLASLDVSRSAGERLTALFQDARFSAHTIGVEMKHDAIEALGDFRDELAGEGL